MKPPFKEVWPETVVFWGAGASLSLGLPATLQIGKCLATLAGSGDESRESVPLEARVRDAFAPIALEEDIPSLQRMFHLLEKDPEIVDPRDSKPARKLQERYDWRALRRMIHTCPGASDAQKFKPQDLFNLIDLHTHSRHGFSTRTQGEDRGENEQAFLEPDRILRARNAVKMLTSTVMFLAWRRARVERQDQIANYSDFARALATLMREETIRFHDDGHPIERRAFYLFSYAVISMNWDPVLMWMLFMAHCEENLRAPWLGSPALPTKLFHDLGYFMGVRKVEDEEPRVWFPVNETATQRLNDPEHQTGRRLRIGKFYFPHGCTSFRECPSCGKLSALFGDSWAFDSATLFPPPPLAEFSEGPEWVRYRRCEQEEKAFERGDGDSILCAFCSNMTDTRHAPLVMQSGFKGEHPPYLEEIQRDMRIALERAKHVVLLGYSLPEDDFIYRALLSARRNQKKPPYCSIVNHDPNLVDAGWLDLDRAKERTKERKTESLIEQAEAIFGDRVRFHFAGMPDCVVRGSSVDKDAVRELLYPVKAFPEGFAVRATDLRR